MGSDTLPLLGRPLAFTLFQQDSVLFCSTEKDLPIATVRFRPEARLVR